MGCCCSCLAADDAILNDPIRRARIKEQEKLDRLRAKRRRLRDEERCQATIAKMREPVPPILTKMLYSNPPTRTVQAKQGSIPVPRPLANTMQCPQRSKPVHCPLANKMYPAPASKPAPGPLAKTIPSKTMPSTSSSMPFPPILTDRTAFSPRLDAKMKQPMQIQHQQAAHKRSKSEPSMRKPSTRKPSTAKPSASKPSTSKLYVSKGAVSKGPLSKQAVKNLKPLKTTYRPMELDWAEDARRRGQVVPGVDAARKKKPMERPRLPVPGVYRREKFKPLPRPSKAKPEGESDKNGLTSKGKQVMMPAPANRPESPVLPPSVMDDRPYSRLVDWNNVRDICRGVRGRPVLVRNPEQFPINPWKPVRFTSTDPKCPTYWISNGSPGTLPPLGREYWVTDPDQSPEEYWHALWTLPRNAFSPRRQKEKEIKRVRIV